MFKDDFERELVGDDYFATSPAFRIDDGRLCVKGARNHPLWLRHRLPTNARIEVEAETKSDDGDIKLEAWGDGHAAATRISYTDATSYLAIFGGWKRSKPAGTGVLSITGAAPGTLLSVVAPPTVRSTTGAPTCRDAHAASMLSNRTLATRCWKPARKFTQILRRIGPSGLNDARF